MGIVAAAGCALAAAAALGLELLFKRRDRGNGEERKGWRRSQLIWAARPRRKVFGKKNRRIYGYRS